MIYKRKILLSLFLITLCCLIFAGIGANTSVCAAEEATIAPAAQLFELPDNNDYNIEGQQEVTSFVYGKSSLGSFSINGDIDDVATYRGKTAYTYFVGESEILVHNTCNDVFRKAGNEAGKKAKAQALDDIVAGRNYKKWGLNPSNPKDLEVIKYVQKYKTFKGSGCEFAHAIDVNVIKDAYKSGKITYQQALNFCANPNNGILTSKATHRLLIHAGNVNNPSNLSIILKARPSIRETVKMIQAVLGVVA